MLRRTVKAVEPPVHARPQPPEPRRVGVIEAFVVGFLPRGQGQDDRCAVGAHHRLFQRQKDADPRDEMPQKRLVPPAARETVVSGEVEIESAHAVEADFDVERFAVGRFPEEPFKRTGAGVIGPAAHRKFDQAAAFRRIAGGAVAEDRDGKAVRLQRLSRRGEVALDAAVGKIPEYGECRFHGV
ncbi:hypothetical protein SDC9_94000 [bioreactor metagenome]|uniref:Uncharacterized protein n=1 Tax=bioreactor metagenome TaxID=1076179 RepID=A0A645A2N7_9ZZZZ